MSFPWLFCLVAPAVLVVGILAFFLNSASRPPQLELSRPQKTLQLLLGLLAGTGAAALLFLIPGNNDFFVYALLLLLFCLVDLLALVVGGIGLSKSWRFVGFGLLAAAVIIPVLLLVRLHTLPPYTPFIFH